MMWIARLYNLLKSDERGQGTAEYGLILILIVAAAVAAFAIFGPQLSALFTRVGSAISSP
jgi:Flp pilus assembly pilin Flp